MSNLWLPNRAVGGCLVLGRYDEGEGGGEMSDDNHCALCDKELLHFASQNTLIADLQRQLAEAQDEIEWLKQGLHNYGRHLIGCSVFIDGQDIACDCGFARSQLVGENS
jgi:hypothetical protein